MKHLLFVSLILAAVIANARQQFTAEIVEDDPNFEISIKDSATEAQAVEDCGSECRNRGNNRIAARGNIASIEETADHLQDMNASEWGNSCRGFVNNGDIGVHGETVRSEIMKPGAYANIKRGDSDLARICPNYPRMNDSSKANVILLIMTAMAFEESTCNNSASARGPNGTAQGFFQLHLGREASYAGSGGDSCKNYDSRTPEGSIRCALETINNQMAEGPMFRQDGNYWDVLRPQRWSSKRKSYFPNPSYAEIRETIAEFEPCSERTSSSQQPSNLKEQFFKAMDKRFKKKETISYEI